jgi:tRNA A-37 threonylcarbamoyl transferase component Bud32
MRIQLVPHEGLPGFLDLPWEAPLAEWKSDRLVEIEHGIGRHVVRFVRYAGSYFALKELPDELVAREYRLLRALRERDVPAVEPLGTVVGRPSGDGILLTRHLDYSLPYRLVLRQQLLPDFWERLLDALAELLVRLHLAGFFWGDCSLSNSLFRRDAGALAAYLVDTETGELHERLSDGQRRFDLDIAEMNLAGELLDLEQEAGPFAGREPEAVAADVRRRYERLWGELTDDEVFGLGERHRLEGRLRRLNELGFDVEQIELVSDDGGYRLILEPKVVEPGHHRRRLLHLTGLDAQENQARRLLNDLTGFRAQLEQTGESVVSETAVAGRWLAEVFEPTIAAIPSELCGKRDAAELYHELLEHRWFLSEAAGEDVGFDAALGSYVDVLRGLSDERAALSSPPDLLVEREER